MSNRPRRHVLIQDDRFFKYLNFAFDKNRHVTRILTRSQSKFNANDGKPVFYDLRLIPQSSLYKTESIIGCDIQFEDGYVYHVSSEAIFDKNDIIYKDWWIMRADIACMYDKTTSRLFYHPLSAYCKALSVHSLSYIATNNWACLSQLWVRGPKDNVSDCSMSYCTHFEDKTGKFCNFDLGLHTKQSYINENPGASRYLSLCYAIRPVGPFNIEHRYREEGYQVITTANIKNIYENYAVLEIIAFEELLGCKQVCEDAEGWLDLNFYNCQISSNRVYMKNGIATVTVFVNSSLAKVGVNSTHPDSAILEFSNDF